MLRSLGKFFGLAGARVGFVLAEASLRTALAERLGPWTIAGPARQIASLALQDRAWQLQQRARLQAASERLRALLVPAGLIPDGSCALFQWLRSERAEALHEAFAAQGILTRLYRDERPGLRFGLPAAEADWLRLREALDNEAVLSPSSFPRRRESGSEVAGAACASRLDPRLRGDDRFKSPSTNPA